MTAPPAPLFPLGRVVATTAVLRMAEEHGIDLSLCLSRHMVGDWGTVCDDDKAVNEEAVREGYRILSSYGERGPDGDLRVWVITEADRSSTTILRPADY